MARMLREALRKYPLVTNTCVYASFYTAAEFSQQIFNKYYTIEKPDVDPKAAACVILSGTTVYAPSLFFWYRFLDRTLSGTTMATVVKKVSLDQFFMTPILLSSFFVVNAILEGREDITVELRQKYLKALCANQLFWIPAATVNFAYVPPHMRVVYVSMLSFVWINVLCFIKRQKTI